MNGISFRVGERTDALCVSVLATQVFLDTYARDGIRPSLAREVLERLSLPAVEAMLAAPSVHFILAEKSGHLVGFVQLTRDAGHACVSTKPAAEINRLYVLERFTSQGIGKALLGRAEVRAASQGARAIWLTAWIGNPRALGFYARQGYSDVGASVYSFEGEDYENRVVAKHLGGSG